MKWFGAHSYFRRRSKTGHLIMTAARKPFSTGITIFFVNGTEVFLELRSFLENDFEFLGRRYRWEGCTILKNEEGEVVARYDQSYAGVLRDGRLEIYSPGKSMIDIIVATLMMLLLQEFDKTF
jgi:hypothetical protein